MKVGMIGVGLMGHGIARNVIGRGGFPLAFMQHPGNQPVDDLLAQGAEGRASAAEVAADADVVILCVTDSTQVEAVLTGASGVLARLRPGAVVIDCSTSIPDSTLRMAAAVQQAGGAFLDAPMTRTVQHAHDGKLNLLVGGDAAVLARVRPVLASFTENVEHVGPIGFGHRLKLLHNFVSIGFMSLLAEAAAQAADAGVDPKLFVDILAKGGGAGAALQRLSPYMIAGDSSGIPFFISNAVKDIGYYRQMAGAADGPRTIADGVWTVLDAAARQGHGQAYIPELIRFLRRGAEPRP